MVRTLIIEDAVKDDIDESFNKNACSLLIGSVFEEKRYVVAVFQVPHSGDLENDFEGSVQQLQYALPGGCYLVGVISNEKTLSLLDIIRKCNQKLQKLVAIDDTLLEPLVLYKNNNKVDGKVMIDGQLKPLSTKYQSFFSSWNEACSHINIDQNLNIPKFESVKQWKTSFRSEVYNLVKNLNSCKIHLKGNSCRGEKNYFEEPGKSKNTIGKVLHPKLIFPLTGGKKVNKTNLSTIVGSVYLHIYLPPKITTEQARNLMMEDVVKSLYCRAESYCEFAEQEIETRCDNSFEDSPLKLPYRVTFPIGLIELSIYLLQDERISQAQQVAGELFDLHPTNIKAHEECRELATGGSLDDDAEEDDKDEWMRKVLVATLGGVVAILVAVVLLSNSYPLN